MELKIGDRVKVSTPHLGKTGNKKIRNGMTGTVKKLIENFAGVEFDDYMGGHNGSWGGKQGYCWYLFYECLEKIEEADTETKEERTSTDKEKEMVNHPVHYTSGKVECIDAIESATGELTGIEAVCTGNIIKYVWRWKFKNGVEDLEKASWYLNKLIEKKKIDENGEEKMQETVKEETREEAKEETKVDTLARKMLEMLREEIGVEIGEEFDAYKNGEKQWTCKFEENGHLTRCHEDGTFRVTFIWKYWVFHFDKYVFKKKPLFPIKEEPYFYVQMRLDNNGNVIYDGVDYVYWYGKDVDIAMLITGNCFKTEEEAEANKEKVIERMNKFIEQVKGEK